VPGAAGDTAKRPCFIARSAQASPPPENIAYETFFEGANRATLTLSPCSLTAETGTSATRSSSSRSSRVQAAVAASAARATALSSSETAKLAPSPPNTKGNLRPPSAFDTAAMTEAPAVLTALYRPSSIALVELTTSVSPSTQSSGSGWYRAGSMTLAKPSKIGSRA